MSLYLSLRAGDDPTKSSSEARTLILPVDFFSLLTQTVPLRVFPTETGGYDSKAPEIASIS